MLKEPWEKEKGMSLPELIVYSFIAIVTLAGVVFIMMSMFNSSSQVMSVNKTSSKGQVLLINIREDLKNSMTYSIDPPKNKSKQILKITTCSPSKTKEYHVYVFGPNNNVYYKTSTSAISVPTVATESAWSSWAVLLSDVEANLEGGTAFLQEKYGDVIEMNLKVRTSEKRTLILKDSVRLMKGKSTC